MGRRLALVGLLLAAPAQADDEGVRAGWFPLSAGLVAGAAGAVMLWQARVQYEQLTNPALPPLGAENGSAVAGTGRVYQAGGFTAAGIGAAGLVAGTVMLLWPKGDVSAVPLVGPGVVGVGLVGTW